MGSGVKSVVRQGYAGKRPRIRVKRKAKKRGQGKAKTKKYQCLTLKYRVKSRAPVSPFGGGNIHNCGHFMNSVTIREPQNAQLTLLYEQYRHSVAAKYHNLRHLPRILMVTPAAVLDVKIATPAPAPKDGTLRRHPRAKLIPWSQREESAREEGRQAKGARRP